MTRRLPWWLAAILWIATPALGQRSVLTDSLVRHHATLGLRAVYGMQFDEADEQFQVIASRHPNHPIGPFLAALGTWWKILLDYSNTEHDESFYAAMTAIIDQCNGMLDADKDNFDAMFFKGMALGFRGRLRTNRREYIRAAADGKRAMDYVLEVGRRYPESHDFAFGEGLYKYYAAIIRERFPVMRPLVAFFPKNDRAEGLAAIERTAMHGHYFKTEATYFLLQIYYNYEDNYSKTIEHISWLRAEHPGNSFFHTLEGRIYLRWGYWDRVASIFDDVLDRFKRGAPGYTAAMAEQALYYLARSHMVAGRYQDASSLLLQLEALSARLPHDTYFKVMGRLQAGMAYDVQGQRKMAETRYRQVRSMRGWGDSQEQAQRYLRTPFVGGKAP